MERLDKLESNNNSIKIILNLWEKEGIEVAMDKYYLGYVKEFKKLNFKSKKSQFIEFNNNESDDEK
jgi:hypothetical protein